MAEKLPVNNNIDLSVTEKKRFSINDDPNRVIWLNTSDMSIVNRLKDIEPKLITLLNEAQTAIGNIADEDTAETLGELADTLADIDAKMRGLVNDIFGTDVSTACAPEGTMYDMFDGQFRFEIIISKLITLYSDNINKEFDTMKKKSEKYMKKYRK